MIPAVIRPLVLADMPRVHELVRELAVFEKSPESHTATVADYERDFRAGLLAGHAAEIGGETVGMTLFFPAYSSWRGPMLYLEDFVVTEAHRGSGVGQLLFDAFLQEARSRGCALVKWQVLDWNETALRFYRRQGAQLESEWLNGKIFLSARP
jgi:GNAT superfamily N-acetyltransferase